MAYKGDDLQLRATSARALREAIGAGDGPNGGWRQTGKDASAAIEVDETVLACCNQAYDAAMFHASLEVGLEHLVHAMTRIGAAVARLEQRGIRSDELRRDSAVAIASAAPVRDGRSAPRASLQLEEALQRAGRQAREHQAPVTVDDLLRVLLDAGPDAPAAALLLRSATNAEELLQWREQPHRESPLLGVVPAQHKGLRADVAEALLQRLDATEAALRSLQAQVAAERQTISAGLQQIHQSLVHRAEVAAGLAPDQLQALDAALSTRLDDLGKTIATLNARPAAAETSELLGPAMQAFEQKIAAQSRYAADTLSSLLSDRLDRIEARAGPAPAAEQLAALEAALQAQVQRAAEAAKAHEHALAEIYEALVKLGTNQQALGQNFDTWRLEHSGDMSIISNKLEQAEQTSLGVLTRINHEFQSLREEASEAGGIGAFKRWLFGTRHVLADPKLGRGPEAGKKS